MPEPVVEAPPVDRAALVRAGADDAGGIAGPDLEHQAAPVDACQHDVDAQVVAGLRRRRVAELAAFVIWGAPRPARAVDLSQAGH